MDAGGGPAKSDMRTLFLAGDVMLGRGIDQVLLHPSAPALHEPSVKDAREYVDLAERTNGAVPRRTAPDYIWGDALPLMKHADVRIVNLETSVTTSDAHWQGKAVHYRMHPDNIPVLTTADIDVCCLANNHVLDWGYAGLEQTLTTLARAGIRTAGAGMDLVEAEAPAIAAIPGKGRVIVFSLGAASSGIEAAWAAGDDKPGVALLAGPVEKTLLHIGERISSVRQEGDIVVVSLHWGANWGYDVSSEEIELVHGLIGAGADIVHGHSSHHAKGIEVWHDRLILYGCGDLLNDYEGLPAYAGIRSDLGLLFFATLERTGSLLDLRMVPTRTRNLRINRATKEEARQLADILRQEGKKLSGTEVELRQDGTLQLLWQDEASPRRAIKGGHHADR